MTLHKKDGMWISDWNVSDGANDEGCYKRQKEQDRKARAIVAKLKTQGWKRIPEKKVNNTLMFIIGSAELLTALKKYNADVKKKWANKKVSTSIPGRRVQTTPAWKYHSFFPHGDVKSELQEWFSDDYYSFDSYFIGELGGYGALMNKGNQYRIIMTGGSDDDEAAHWSTPVFQLALKGQSKLAKTVKKAKPKPKDKPIMSGKGQQYVMKGTGRGVRKTPAKKTTKYVLGKKDRPTDIKKRKSPPYSAKQFPKGARKKGNNGKMWSIVTDKRGVKRWKA